MFLKKSSNKIIYKKNFLIININKKSETKINMLKISLITFFAGIITSLTGMSGGPIIMPALVLLCYLNMKEAAPISHTIIMISSLINLIIKNENFTNSSITLNFLLPLSFAAIISTVSAFF
ncbi:sulfite exporter TauE/SafE family protein [Spiroplasma taiwanense]|uniref:Probable membrane transporter protein n=1 Tax=Spiroplasma taiwanense CT-1 TaxID=1276220 RepID=S5LZW0_9MOLU|nr:sulfite exporter TauE/SafE family protein [Spiroplasma taiwanense]AGR41262.1 hypothetical protein STAIW_v1c06440 [Spiroplasma taiwanense CT-1]